MIVQSLNVCVPGGCPNKCKFCVARMHANDYVNIIEDRRLKVRTMGEGDYKRRLQFARDNGCNTAVLTGIGEPLSNQDFLERFARWNRELPSPFKWIELQTSGVYLDGKMLDFLRKDVGVSTVSLSTSSLFGDDDNSAINGTPEKLRFRLEDLCSLILDHGLNLRLAVNMHSLYNLITPESLFTRAMALGAHQITLKRLDFTKGSSTPEDQWVEKHQYTRFEELQEYIKFNGRALEVMPYGTTRYSVHGMSTVIDADCMSSEAKEVVKYLVLRPDCRLYTKWDDRGSLLF